VKREERHRRDQERRHGREVFPKPTHGVPGTTEQ
jgi:hypothetical protein